LGFSTVCICLAGNLGVPAPHFENKTFFFKGWAYYRKRAASLASMFFYPWVVFLIEPFLYFGRFRLKKKTALLSENLLMGDLRVIFKKRGQNPHPKKNPFPLEEKGEGKT